jgi:iron complex outermembrane receptor protein
MSNLKLKPLVLTVAAGFLGAGVTSSAYAQQKTATEAESGAIAIEEIVVTARKKRENLQQSPVSITAVSGEELQARGLSSITDFGQFTPNVSLTSGSTDIGGAANAVFFIRGIGQLDYAPTNDSGIGVYVDGVYQGRSQGAVLDLVDVQQIEVLKGPQGTLFGRNAMGGALNITTRDPSFELSRSIGLTLGELNRVNVDAELNVPISDTVAARFTIGTRNKDGFVNRPNTGSSVGAEGQQIFHGKLLLKPSNETKILLAADYTRIKTDGNTLWVTESNPTGLLALWNAVVAPTGLHGPAITSASSSRDPRTDFGTYPNAVAYNGGGLSARIDHDFGSWTLRSVTAYRSFNSRNQRDMDGTASDFGTADYRDNQSQVSQEFDFIGTAFDKKLDWTAGAFLFKEHVWSDWEVGLANGLFNALEALPGPVIPFAPGVSLGGAGNPFNALLDTHFHLTPEQKTNSRALFGEGEWHFTTAFSAIAGVRYTEDQKDFSMSQFAPISNTTQINNASANATWHDVSPRLGVKYQAAANLMVYATASKGYKAGGFNSRPAANSATIPYGPESVTSYEIGAKTDWADRRLRLNGAIFDYDYKDIQEIANMVLPGSPAPVAVIDNIGKARYRGAEADLTFRATDRFTLYANVGYLDAKYLEAAVALTGVGLDTPLPKAPKWSATLSAQYAEPVPSGRVVARVDYSFVSKNYSDARATEAIAQQAHGLVNARVAWMSHDGEWTAAVYAKNLLDKKYVLNGFDVSSFAGYMMAIPSQPRELGVQLVKNF